jgi:DNA-binding NtrC family response regulator
MKGISTTRGLVVDDNAGVRNGVRRVLASTGLSIELHEAATAVEAYKKLTSVPKPLDFVLADQRLQAPSDGLLVALFARRLGVPLVCVWTGHEIDADMQLELEALGICAFTKTVTPDQKLPPSEMPEAVLQRIAELMQRVGGSITDVAKQALAEARDQAMAKHGNNKVHAAKSLGVERKFIDRAVAWKRK